MKREGVGKAQTSNDGGMRGPHAAEPVGLSEATASLAPTALRTLATSLPAGVRPNARHRGHGEGIRYEDATTATQSP